MNAGFVSKKREEQLWEVQRIITQLKRKLRSFEKRQEKSMEESQTAGTSTLPNSSDTTDSKSTQLPHSCDALLVNGSAKTPVKPGFTEDETKNKTNTKLATESPETTAIKDSLSQNDMDYEATAVVQEELQNVILSEQSPLAIDGTHPDGFYIDEDSSFLMVPKTHPEYSQLIRLQLENQELLAWKNQLQARITAERAEVLRLKQHHQQLLAANSANAVASDDAAAGGDYDKVIEHYIRENTLLENKKQMLLKEIFDERRECIAMQVELALQKF